MKEVVMMTWRKRIEDLFATGEFSTTAKLTMVLFYWALGKISDSDAADLFTECGYTFTKPTAIDQTILTNGTISYTIVSLITTYHDNDWKNSMVAPASIEKMIDSLHSSGYITTEEQTSLKGLGWE